MKLQEKDVRQLIGLLNIAYEEQGKEWAFEELAAYVRFCDYAYEMYPNLRYV